MSSNKTTTQVKTPKEPKTPAVRKPKALAESTSATSASSASSASTTTTTKKTKQVVELTPVPTTTSTTTSTASTASTTETTTADVVDTKKVRGKTNGLNQISSARVRRDIDSNNINKLNEERMAVLKASISEYLQAKKIVEAEESTADDKAKSQAYLNEHAARHHDVDQQMKALSRDKVRFSNDASRIISLVCDHFVSELAIHAMKQTVASKKKSVKIAHLHKGDLHNLSFFALIHDLPSFVATTNKLAEKELARQQAEQLEKTLAQAEKDFKKKHSIHLTKEQKEQDKLDKKEKKQKQKDDAADSKEDKEDDVTYRYYIGILFQNHKPHDVQLRITNDVKTYLSKLVDEFITKLADQLLLTIHNMKNKTINERAILHAVKTMLVANCAYTETLSINKQEVTDKNKNEYEVVHERIYTNCGYYALETSINELVEKLGDTAEPVAEMVQ